MRRARAMPPRVAQARFETFKPGVDELEAEIAEKKRWLVQLDSPGGEKEVRELMRRRKSGLGAAAGATDPGSMTAKYGLAPRPKSERPTAAERAAARTTKAQGARPTAAANAQAASAARPGSTTDGVTAAHASGAGAGRAAGLGAT